MSLLLMFVVILIMAMMSIIQMRNKENGIIQSNISNSIYYMDKNLKKRLISWVIPLAVGGLATLLSGGTDLYRTINQPPLSPPAWVFPLVWTALYIAMGEAAYRVLTSGADKGQIKNALIAYGVQLFLNFLWPLFFFGGQMYLTAFIILILLWVAVFITTRRFSRIDENAGDLLLPYLGVNLNPDVAFWIFTILGQIGNVFLLTIFAPKAQTAYALFALEN